jgi:hypothetical protein
LKKKHLGLCSIKLWKRFYGISFFAGVVLMVFEVWIYRRTIIHIGIPISIIVGLGIVSFLFIKGHYRRIFKVKGVFFPLMQSMLSFGFIACYLFMAGNFYWANDGLRTYEFKIAEKSSMPGRKGKINERTPLVRFDYFGMKKELVFGSNSAEKVHNSSYVTLTMKKGAFGFDVIETYGLK